jgi:hypothetical protein
LELTEAPPLHIFKGGREEHEVYSQKYPNPFVSFVSFVVNENQAMSIISIHAKA